MQGGYLLIKVIWSGTCNSKALLDFKSNPITAWQSDARKQPNGGYLVASYGSVRFLIL